MEKFSKETQRVIFDALKRSPDVQAFLELQKILAEDNLSNTPKISKKTKNRRSHRTKEEARADILKIKSAIRERGPMKLNELARILTPHGNKSGRKYKRDYNFIWNLVDRGVLEMEDKLISIP